MFATPNGTRNSLFWPTGTETNSTLNTLTRRLEPYKSKLTFLKGIKLNPSLQNGALGGTLGSEHARGTGGMLTARPLKSGTQFKSFGNTTSGWGSGQSLDQYLAGRLAPTTTFPSLQLGVHVRDTEVRARISYAGADQPIPPREDPKDVFAALFGMPTGGTSGTTDPALARLWAQRKSVFDATNAETERIKNLVGANDRDQAGRPPDGHARRRAAPGRHDRHRRCRRAAPARSRRCQRRRPQERRSQYLQAGQLQMDLAVAALACDQTRIITFQWSYSESEHLFGFLNISGNHHVISHDFASSGANYDAYNKIQTWYQQQFAYLLAKMDAVQGRRSQRCSTTASCCGRPRSASRRSTT